MIHNYYTIEMSKWETCWKKIVVGNANIQHIGKKALKETKYSLSNRRMKNEEKTTGE